MRRLGITLRISAYAVLTALAFAVFMVFFFPAQAARMSSRVMSDSAVTVANVFAASIAPALGARDAASDQLLDDALHSLAGESARRDDTVDRARIASATIWDAKGVRIAGWGDGQRAHEAVEPRRTLTVEALDSEGILRVTAPVLQDGAFEGFFRIDFSTATFDGLARHNLWMSLLGSLVLGGSLIAIAFFVGRSIAAPMVRVAAALATASMLADTSCVRSATALAP